ncbi:MAG: restriction endonuclease [Kiritimatiellae bacterium]|nr:restriction endonuclease [Kiritimatiellia bacterium]
MSRKRTGIASDIYDLLVAAPWWFGVLAAGVFSCLGLFVIPMAFKDASQLVLRPLFKALVYGLAFISILAAAISALKASSRRRLLDRQQDLQSLRSLSWREFEHLVGEAYRRQGYDVEETGGGGADGGIDLVLRGHGQTILVQCKQWRDQQVGVDKVRELFGVLSAEGASRAILVTSGRFTDEALSFKVGKPLTIVDGPALASLVQSLRTPTNHPSPAAPSRPSASVAPACPLCGSPMALRTAKRGPNAGYQFYGCTKYPACRGIRDA